MMTKVNAESYTAKSINRLNYGIYFKHIDTVKVLSDYFLTTVKLLLPHTVQLSNTASRSCSEHRPQNDRSQLACHQHLQFWRIQNQIHEHAESRIQTLFDTITSLIPGPHDLQRNRRSLIPQNGFCFSVTIWCSNDGRY